MLSLLCSSPRSTDTYRPAVQRSRSKRHSMPPPVSSVVVPQKQPKRRILKASIGSPEDFRHEQHVGQHTPGRRPELWDIERWEREIEERSPTLTGHETGLPPPTPPKPGGPRTPKPSPPQKPLTRSASANLPTPPKRKAVPPPSVPPVATVSPFPSTMFASPPRPPTKFKDESPPVSYGSPSSPPLDPSVAPKRLVPLLRKANDTPYVTQTTKMKWDGAMDEIERALRQG